MECLGGVSGLNQILIGHVPRAGRADGVARRHLQRLGLRSTLSQIGSADSRPLSGIVNNQTTRSARTVMKVLQCRLDVNLLRRQDEANYPVIKEISRLRSHTTVARKADEIGCNRNTGGFVLVDEASNRTVAATMINAIKD